MSFYDIYVPRKCNYGKYRKKYQSNALCKNKRYFNLPAKNSLPFLCPVDMENQVL